MSNKILKKSPAVVILAGAMLAGCAGNPERPVEDIAAANVTIERAEQAGARRYSSADLDMARQKLADAKAASERGNYVAAERLAEQARLDAEYAAAAADTAKAREAVAAVQGRIDTLRREIQRQQGG